MINKSYEVIIAVVGGKLKLQSKRIIVFTQFLDYPNMER